MFNDDVLDYARRSVLCWLATVDADGQPNVSPKELFLAQPPDRLLIANIASPVSAANVRARPQVCVSFVDVFVQKGFKVQGTARLLLPADAGFDALAAPLQALAGDALVVRGVFEVSAQVVAPIVAPSYRFVEGTDEAGQVASAMRSYGVRSRR